MSDLKFSRWGDEYTDVESAFVRAFSNFATTTSINCECGRTYFTSAIGCGDYEEGELEKLQRKREKNPDKYFESTIYDTIDLINFGGNEYEWH